uniref:Uncharacterized protein n=1 Tax=Brassica campestris TaxID=3711 RepID=M4FHF6_BRACM
MEEMMKTTKAGEELVQAKMRREITKLDDEEEVGPRFQLLFKGVKKVSLDTGSLKLICMPPASHYDYPERQLMMPPL